MKARGKDCDMAEYNFIKTGKDAERKPKFRPNARGLFMVLEDNPACELSEDDYMKINLHAQKELCNLSKEFEKALKHWTRLPKTPKRQLGGLVTTVARLDDDCAAQEWIDGFKDYDGLVYAFDIEQEIDLQTGEKRTPFPVIGFSPTRGFDFLDDLKDKHCAHYRLYFLFTE